MDYLTKKEVCEMLRVSPQFINRKVKSGKLRMIKLSRRFVRFRPEDVRAFMESASAVEGSK